MAECSNTSNVWYLWLDRSRSPAMNMAADDVLLHHVADWGAVLRFYGWNQPAVSIGYFQPLAAAGNPACKVVRRPSGGGVVDHRHDLTFSLVVDAAHPLFSVDRFESYRLVNDAVCQALKEFDPDLHTHRQDTPKSVDRRQLICFDTPARHDVVGSRGKICGGAQRRRSYGMLHQGSLRMDRLPDVSRRKIRERLIASLAALLPGEPERFLPPDKLKQETRRLAREQYGNPSWNQKR